MKLTDIKDGGSETKNLIINIMHAIFTALQKKILQVKFILLLTIFF